MSQDGRRTVRGGLGLFFIALAIRAVLAALQCGSNDQPSDVAGTLIFAALFALIGAYLLRIRRKPGEAKEEPVQQQTNQPMVRKEGLIAMAIMFVSFMAIVFTTCGGHGVIEGAF